MIKQLLLALLLINYVNKINTALFLFDQTYTKRYIDKNFYDHKEIGHFLQGKKSAKCCKNRKKLK